jgi:hypothetical protein
LELQRKLLESHRYRALGEAEFIRELEAAGAEGAAEFFDRWRHGDASLGFDARVDGDSVVIVTRTGTVSYPVDVEVTTSGGTTRHTMSRSVAEDTIAFDKARGVQFRLDPGGAIPMWNSSNWEIQSLFIEALDRADLTQAFISLAGSHLGRNPADVRIRFLLTRRLYNSARYDEALTHGSVAACNSADGCQALLYAAQSMARLGRPVEAAQIIEREAAPAQKFGLATRWERARKEVGSQHFPERR